MARIQIEGIEMTFDFNIQNAITNSKKIQAQLKQTFSKIKNDASSNDAQKELTNTQKIMQRNFKLVRDAKKRMAQTMNQKESTLTSKKSNIRIGGMSAEEYKAKIDAQANSMVNSAKNAHARVQQVQNKAMGESAFGQAARKYSEASNKSWQNFNQVEMYKEPIGPQLPQKKEPLQYFGSSGAPPNDSSKTPNKFNLGVLQQMQSSMFKTMGIGTKLGAILGGIGSRFTRGARNMTPGTSMMQKGLGNVGNSVDRVISRIVSLAKRIFFFTMIAKGFRMIRESIGSYLATDKQFSNSLNQVRVNLLTAFYPIYTTILPYINMFMTGLANVTGQLAAFLSMLTGT
ncbi:MAG: hypothetical protein LBV67_11170, partial [Streptococcaceae bacterium]|nr:hypothetical protein [Streptococcaceae bacterium]